MGNWLTGAKMGLIAWIILLFITLFVSKETFLTTFLLGWVIPVIGWCVD